MSDDNSTPEPASEITYTSDSAGLREAAAAVTARRGGPPDNEPVSAPAPEAIDGQPVDEEQGVTIKRAATSLADWRRQMSEQDSALQRALGLAPEAAPVEAQPGEQQAQPEPPQIDPAQVQQQIEAALGSNELREATAVTHALAQNFSLADHRFATEFPEIKSAADLAILQQRDPARFEKAWAEVRRAAAIAGQHQRLTAEVEKFNAAGVEAWNETQDSIFAKRHPELKDPKVAGEIAEIARRELMDYGLTAKDVAAMWNGQPFSLRNHIAQEVLLDAIKFRAGKRAIKTAARKPVPQVQRPGVRSMEQRDPAGLEAAARQMRSNPTIKNAGRHLAARRAAARENG